MIDRFKERRGAKIAHMRRSIMNNVVLPSKKIWNRTLAARTENRILVHRIERPRVGSDGSQIFEFVDAALLENPQRSPQRGKVAEAMVGETQSIAEARLAREVAGPKARIVEPHVRT